MSEKGKEKPLLVANTFLALLLRENVFPVNTKRNLFPAGKMAIYGPPRSSSEGI
jgi:hypothetical protein